MLEHLGNLAGGWLRRAVLVAACMIGTVMMTVTCQAAPAVSVPVPVPVPVRATGGTVDDFIDRSYDDGAGHKLPYRLFVPRGQTPKGIAKRKYPLVLFLHGAGGRGTDNRGQLADQDAALVFVKPENQAKWPVFMVAPQCPPDQQWVDMPWGAPTGKGKRPKNPTWPMTAAISLVDDLLRRHPEIDPGRLYVTGMSMGGYGTWDAAVRHPTKWQAAVIVCGGYDQLAIAPLVEAHLPIWAFHAEDDRVVPVSRSRELIAALRARGATPRYTEYPASDHHGHFSWHPAYSNSELLPWMFGPAPAVPQSR